MTSQLLEINEKLDLILSSNLSNKKALSLVEASKYIGISKTYLYQLTHRNLIPYYKPNGKNLYFDREELESWLLTNHHRNIKADAKEYIKNNRGVK